MNDTRFRFIECAAKIGTKTDCVVCICNIYIIYIIYIYIYIYYIYIIKILHYYITIFLSIQTNDLDHRIM